MQRVASVALLLLTCRYASAERVNGAYVEALGKGGLWGVGYDRSLVHRLSVGVVGSMMTMEGQSYLTLSPYLGLYIIRRGHHGWFADGGVQFAHVWMSSPVPEWEGDSSTGIGGILSSGYEYRSRVLFRIFAHGAFGKGGAQPWAGIGIGWSF